MLKTSFSFYFLFMIMIVLIPSSVSGQAYESTYGAVLPNKVFTTLLKSDLDAVFDSGRTNLRRWLDHMDACYIRLQELTGYTPFNGVLMGIESAVDDPGYYAWAGNPIGWNQIYIPSALIDINASDDWWFPIIHEISHNFDHENWMFHCEVTATFKALYIIDNESTFLPTGKRAELESMFSTDFTSAAAAFTNHGIVRPSIEHRLIQIQNTIGWAPFIATFNNMCTMANPPQTRVDKFMTFLLFLGTYSSQNVIGMIPADELAQMRHMLDDNELCKWDSSERIGLTAVRTPSGTIELAWDDIYGSEDGYEIQYSINGGSFQPLVDTAADSTGYIITNFSPSSAYRFRVRAYNTSTYISYRAYSFLSNEPEVGVVPAGSYEMLYKTMDTNATNNDFKPCFKIVNKSGASVNLSEFKIRYWYTIGSAASQNFFCDYAAVGNGNVTGAFVTVSPTRSGADRYLEVSFTAGAGQVANNGNTGEIQTRCSKSDWSNFNENGDYSYDSSKTSYALWNKVTLYRNGQLVWGVEPQ